MTIPNLNWKVYKIFLRRLSGYVLDFFFLAMGLIKIPEFNE